MATTDDRMLEAIPKKLHPDAIRSNLIRAGLFLAGWEILKSEIQKKVREFYGVDIDDGPLSERQYSDRVLALDKGKEKGKAFRASLLWLVERNALTETQAARIRQMLVHRNEIAHELPKVLVEPDHSGVDVAMLHELKDLIGTLGAFWGRIAADTNPDFFGRKIGDGDVVSGVSILMEYLVSAAEDAAPTTVAR